MLYSRRGFVTKIGDKIADAGKAALVISLFGIVPYTMIPGTGAQKDDDNLRNSLPQLSPAEEEGVKYGDAGGSDAAQKSAEGQNKQYLFIPHSQTKRMAEETHTSIAFKNCLSRINPCAYRTIDNQTKNYQQDMLSEIERTVKGEKDSQRWQDVRRAIVDFKYNRVRINPVAVITNDNEVQHGFFFYDGYCDGLLESFELFTGV